MFGALSGAENVLRWSAPLDPTDWTAANGGGFLKLVDEGGSINRVLSFKDGLYVFRDYAIHRMTAYGDQSEYSVSRVYTAAGRIFEDTVAVCGSFIVFLAEDGLYSFDGYTVKRCFQNVTGLISDKSEARGACFGGKYYLSAGCSFGDAEIHDGATHTLKNNAVIELDFSDGTVGILRGVDVSGFIAAKSGDYNMLLAYFRESTGRDGTLAKIERGGMLYTAKLKKFWRSPKTDLGYPAYKKLVRRVSVLSKYDLTLTFGTGDRSVVVNVKGAEVPRTYMVTAIGDVFEFSISAETEKLAVAKIELEVDLL